MRIIFIIFLLMAVGICSAEGLAESGLRLSEAAWASEIRGYNDYVPNETGEFERGKQAYAYIEIAGFETVRNEDGLYEPNIAVDVVLRTTWGLTLFRQNDLIEHSFPRREHPEHLWFYIWVDVPSWAPRSSYVTEIIVRDLHSGEQISESRRIRVI